MTNQTIICGLALVIIGVYGYIKGKEHIDQENAAAIANYEEVKKTDPNAVEPKPKSVMTALIPAVVGGILILCGLIVALVPKSRKHVMHLAAMVGLLGAIGGFMPLVRGNFDFEKSAVKSGALMIVVCAVFVVLCVMSFIEARKARQAAAK